MDIKALKLKMEEAAGKLAASPDDETLKTAHETAKAAYEAAVKNSPPGEDDDDEDDSLDDDSLDEKTKKHIAKLRKENAKYRTKAKTADERALKLEQGLKGLVGGEDDVSPEEKLKNLQSQQEQVSFRAVVLEAALEHGVPKDKLKYFSFLIQEKLSELAEGEELTEENLIEIAKDVKSSGGSGKPPGRTSLDGNPPNPNGKKGDVTLDDFVKMGITERSKLYSTNKGLYDQLFQDAKSKRRL